MSTLDLLLRCRQIPGLSIFVVEMSPHTAELLLKTNTHNRKLTESVVARYEQEMLNDDWRLTPAGIGIDTSGVLIDGQHRLHAIVRSGKTVPLLVLYGLPPGSQEKLDRQEKRSLFDVLFLAGFAEKPKEVQIATFLVLWNNRSKWAHAGALADSEVKACLECHRDSILTIIDIVPSKCVGFGRAGFLSAVVLYHELFPVNATTFLKTVVSGEMLTLDNPCMRLHRYLLGLGSARIGAGRGGLGQFCDFRKSVAAINAYHGHQNISALRETDGFDFCEVGQVASPR